MIKVYTAPDLFWLQHARNPLEFAGIQTFVRNEFAAGALGELSFVDCWPELWVASEANAAKARQILTDLFDTSSADGPEQQCHYCNATCPANFQRCWHCQCPLDAPTHP